MAIRQRSCSTIRMTANPVVAVVVMAMMLVVSSGSDSRLGESAAAATPGCDRLLWVGTPPGEIGGDVWTADADGSQRRQIGVGGLRAWSPAAWSPDGSRIAVNYSVVHADGSNLAPLGGARRLQIATRQPWSPDGRHLIVSGRLDPAESPRAAFVLDTNTQAVRLFDTDAGISDDRRGPRDLAWSPDGSHIAWTNIYDGQLQRGVLHVRDLTDAGAVALGEQRPLHRRGVRQQPSPHRDHEGLGGESRTRSGREPAPGMVP